MRSGTKIHSLLKHRFALSKEDSQRKIYSVWSTNSSVFILVDGYFYKQSGKKKTGCSTHWEAGKQRGVRCLYNSELRIRDVANIHEMVLKENKRRSSQ